MKRSFPPNYGNNWEPVWKEEDFRLGDPVECGFSNPDFGIISFLCEESMSVCTACASGTEDLPHRDINVVVSTVVPVRKLEEDEYTKLDAQLREGCKAKTETASTEASKKGKITISHTIEKRVKDEPCPTEHW